LNFTFLLVWFFVFEAFARVEDFLPIMGSLHPVLVLGIGTTLAHVQSVMAGRARFQWSRELGAVLLLTAWFILGIPFAYWRGGSLRVLMDGWFRTLLFFFLLTQTLTTVGRVRKILWAVLLSELGASVASLLMRGNSVYTVGGRFAGINKGLLGWNFLGITLSVTLPFLACLYVSKRSAVRTSLLFAVLGSTMWMLVLTASRGGVLGIILSVVLTWWFVLRGTARGRALIGILVLTVVVSVAMAPSVFWDRASTIFGTPDIHRNRAAESAEMSTEGRIKLLEASVEDTLHYPVFGLGIGNFSVYHGNQDDPIGWYGTHNTFTQISSEAGLPALLLVVFLIATVIRHMKRVSNSLANDRANVELRLLARATLASALTFVFMCCFAHIAYEYLLYLVIGIAVGVWTIDRHRVKAAQEVVPAPEQLLTAFDEADLQWHHS